MPAVAFRAPVRIPPMLRRPAVPPKRTMARGWWWNEVAQDPGLLPQVRVMAAFGADPAADPATWSWSDITADVRTSDMLRMFRGRTEGSAQAQPATLAFGLNNPDGQYTPGNPTGVWYPYVRQNTPIRVYVNMGAGEVLRGTWYADSWAPGWDTSLNLATVAVSASGNLRRLQQGKARVQSPIYRMLSAQNPAGYWACEDPTGSGSLAEYHGGTPMTFPLVNPTLASDGPDGSAPLPKLVTSAVAGTRLLASVPSYRPPTFGGFTATVAFKVPSAPSRNTPLARWRVAGSGIPEWRLTVVPSGGTDTINLEGFNSAVTQIVTVSLPWVVGGITEPYGRWMFATVTIDDWANRSDFTIADCATGAQASTIGGSFSGLFSGTVTSVEVPPDYPNADTVCGHFAVYPYYSPGGGDPASRIATNFVLTADALNGNSGEAAGTRISTICADNRISFSSTGTLASTVEMGPQPISGVLAIVRECEAADGGILLDGLQGELNYRTRASRYNQTAGLTLDMAAGELAPPFGPVYDDQRRRNDLTASRSSGSSARIADEDDIAEHGRYDDSVTLNVADDTLLSSQAGWRVHLGSGEDMRYPQMSLQLVGKGLALIAAWQGLDIGDRITVANPPAQHPPGDIDVVLEGYTETLGAGIYNVAANVSPYRPWRVWEIGDPDRGRLDTDGSSLVADVSATAVSLSVQRLDSSDPLWTTTAGFPADFPFDVDVGGEQIRVTAIAGSSSPQTFTVTRSVNGVVKAHTANTRVRLWRPTVLGL